MTYDIIILIVTTFIIRIWPRFVYPGLITSMDSYFHLTYSQYYLNHRDFMKLEFNGISGYYTYFYHYLISFFGKRYLVFIENISSAIFDTFGVIAIYLFTYFAALNSGVIESLNFSFWTSLLYSTSPPMFQRQLGPRAFEGTPRTLGENIFLLIILTAGCLLIFKEYQIIFIALCFIFGTMILFTSKFATQSLVFISTLVAIFSNKLQILFFPFGCFIVAELISRGKYTSILKHQWGHLAIYASKLQFTYDQMQDKNNLRRILIKIKKIFHSKQYYRLFGIIIRDFGPTAILYKCPQVILATILILQMPSGKNILTNFTSHYFYYLFWATIIILIVTYFTPFLFIGEAERYQNYSLYLQYLLIAYFAINYNICFVLLSFHAIYYIINVIIFLIGAKSEKNKVRLLKECVGNIKKTYNTATIAVVLGSSTHQLSYYLGEKYDIFPNVNEFHMENYIAFPYTHPKNLDKIISSSDADLLFVEKRAVKEVKNKYYLDYDFTRLARVQFENDFYLLLVVK